MNSCIQRSGTEDEIQLIRLGLNITPEDTLSNAPKLFASQRVLKEQIVTNKTHVFIASQSHVKMIETAIIEINNKVTHISSNKYLDYFIGFVYSKKLDPFVAKHYNDM